MLQLPVLSHGFFLKSKNAILNVSSLKPGRCMKKSMPLGILLLFASSFRSHDVEENDASSTSWHQPSAIGLADPPDREVYKKAVYTSSRIEAQVVLTEDSPDIAIPASVSQSENSIFVHPLNASFLLNSNNSGGTPANSFTDVSAFISSDGGLSWSGIPSLSATLGSDPAVAIDRTGRFYVAHLTERFRLDVAYSDNAGHSWTGVRVAAEADKCHMWVDNALSSPHQGRLYCAWSGLLGSLSSHELMLSYSTDRGASWGPAQVIARRDLNSNYAVNVHTGPEGQVYAVWLLSDTAGTALGFTKSLDGGVSFTPVTKIIIDIDPLPILGTSKSIRVNSFPSMAVDISGKKFDGNLYVVWTNVGNPGESAGQDIDVYMIKSADEGATWSEPIRVNQDAPGRGKQQFFPWIACDPETGALCVIFYDDRNVSTTECEVYVAASLDGGNTWEDFKVSDVAFTPQPISVRAYFGDYLGIAVKAGRVFPCWTDNRNGPNLAATFVSPFTLATTAVQDKAAGPATGTFKSYQNYPNPFNASTTISYHLESPAHVLLKIYTTFGQEVKTLVNEPQTAGRQTIFWDGRNHHGEAVGTGVYICQIRADHLEKTLKMVLIE